MRTMSSGAVNWKRVSGYVAALALIFVLMALKANVYVSAITTTCMILGYFNDFVVLRTVISIVQRKQFDRGTAAPTFGFLVGDAIVIYLGFGLVLALTTVSCIFIDGVILRFR